MWGGAGRAGGSVPLSGSAPPLHNPRSQCNDAPLPPFAPTHRPALHGRSHWLFPTLLGTKQRVDLGLALRPSPLGSRAALGPTSSAQSPLGHSHLGLRRISKEQAFPPSSNKESSPTLALPFLGACGPGGVAPEGPRVAEPTCILCRQCCVQTSYGQEGFSFFLLVFFYYQGKTTP